MSTGADAQAAALLVMGQQQQQQQRAHAYASQPTCSAKSGNDQKTFCIEERFAGDNHPLFAALPIQRCETSPTVAAAAAALL
ncbi:hypothetical protein MY4038_009570 [Beauveria bassiana]